MQLAVSKLITGRTKSDTLTHNHQVLAELIIFYYMPIIAVAIFTKIWKYFFSVTVDFLGIRDRQDTLKN